MLNELIALLERLGQWAYLVIFLGAMLESAAFLGLLVPGESLVLIAGFFVATGALDAGDVFVLVVVGAILGDNIGYALGHRLGRPWLERYGARVRLYPARVARADAFFERHGGKAVLLGRFVGFARALAPFLAGSARMRYREFLLYNAVGALAWSAVVLALGYALGESLSLAQRWIGRGSALLFGALVFAAVLTFAWRYLARHETAIRHAGERLRRTRAGSALARFAEAWLALLRNRLSPGGEFAVTLAAGTVILVGASWVLGGITQDVLAGDPLVAIDRYVAQWLNARTTTGLTQVLLVITQVHGPLGITVLTLATGLYFLWRHRVYWSLFLALAVPGVALVNVLIKHAVHRPRPPFALEHVLAPTYSFPSGHAAVAVAFYGVLALYAVRHAVHWRAASAAAVASMGMVVVVGFSRLYLGVHYLSDVLAGFAEGIAWLALCAMAVATLRRERSGR